MTVITINDFISLIKDVPVETDCFYNTPVSGVISNTLTTDGLKITYSQNFEHPEYKPEKAYLLCELLQYDDVWNIESRYEVIDDEREILEPEQVAEIVFNNSYIDIFLLDCLGKNPAEDFDYDENQPDKKILVERDGMKNLRFTGELMAKVTDYDVFNDIEWTVMKLYKTIHDNYICVIILKTNVVYDDFREGIQKKHSDKNTVVIKADLQEVKECFLQQGKKELAAELFKKADI